MIDPAQTEDEVVMGFRPFGRFRQVGWYYVGDQWPAPPSEVQQAVDGPVKESDYNRFERTVYRWLARPHLLPRRHKQR
jgi:hypothetical protein